MGLFLIADYPEVEPTLEIGGLLRIQRPGNDQELGSLMSSVVE